MDEFRFDGKVAIVTGAGAAAGLGRAHARLLAARGAKVVVNDLGTGPDGLAVERAHAEQVAQEIRHEGGDAIGDTNSVAEEESAKAIVQTALDAYGRVDILVNNAGIVRIAEFEFVTSDDIQQIVAVHLMGNIWMCRAVWPLMFEQQYGRIVNVTSRAMWGARYNVVYGAAKGGVFALTRGLAAEGASRNVRVNALAPGARTTAFYYFNDAATAPQLERPHPPEGVAPAVGYLCHERCALNGAYVASVGGGAVSVGIFGTTHGYDGGLGLTIEDVAAHLDTIRDPRDFTQIPEGVDLVGGGLSLKPEVVRSS
jgi:NAD(P)-dependent dehydrogenase (short-subunit alcohol dehydrogenase family)